MNDTIYEEDAEVRVGVVVRPLRGHWRPAKGAKQTQVDEMRTPSTLDGSIWKTPPDDDNIANMNFTSRMVYSSHRLTGTESRTGPTETPTSGVSLSTSDSTSGPTTSGALVPKCPNSCRCHVTGALIPFDSPAPEKNRIELPPDLAAQEQTRLAAREAKVSAERVRRTGISKPDESTAKEPAKPSVVSDDEIRVTTRPLPPPPKKFPEQRKPLPGGYTRASDKLDGKEGKLQTPRTSKERLQKAKEKLGFTTKLDIQDTQKDSHKATPASVPGTSSSGSLSLPAPIRLPDNPPRQGKRLPPRPTLTQSRSRLKTVTYKEEAFLTEGKSWILLLIFICIIWIYRSTLS